MGRRRSDGQRKQGDAELILQRALEVEARVPCMAGHSARVSRYAVALAERISLSLEDQDAVRLAGLVHDIGKAAVPVDVLLRSGPLSRADRALLESHPVWSEQLCSGVAAFAQALPIIRHHHERLDGSGYPDGLRGSQISSAALVLQTADIFDALSQARPYRATLDPEEVFAIMRQEARNGWRDASLVEELYQIICVCGLDLPAGKAALAATGRRTFRLSDDLDSST